MSALTPRDLMEQSWAEAHRLVNDRLTPRERDVLQLTAKGYEAGEIGRLLGLSVWTVRDHHKAIYKSLGVNSVQEAAVIAAKAGLV